MSGDKPNYPPYAGALEFRFKDPRANCQQVPNKIRQLITEFGDIVDKVVFEGGQRYIVVFVLHTIGYQKYNQLLDKKDFKILTLPCQINCVDPYSYEKCRRLPTPVLRPDFNFAEAKKAFLAANPASSCPLSSPSPSPPPSPSPLPSSSSVDAAPSNGDVPVAMDTLTGTVDEGTEPAFSVIPIKHRPPRARPHPAKLSWGSGRPTDCRTLLFRPAAGHSFHSFPRLRIAQAFSQLQPVPIGCRNIRDGGLAVDFPNVDSVSLFLTLDSLASVPCSVSFPKPRTVSSGVVKGSFESADELKALYNFHSENPPLAAVTRLGNSGVYRLDFEKELPTHVEILYSRVPVSPFFKSPLRCLRCQRFGHVASVCRGTEFCSKCSLKGHNHKSCPSDQKRCVNCAGSHFANDKQCPHRLFHLQANKKAANENLPLPQARAAVAGSYADAVRSKPVPSRASSQAPVPPVASTAPPSQPASVPVSALPSLFATLLAALFPERQFEQSVISELLKGAISQLG